MRPASPEAPAEPLLSLADGVALVRAVLAESTTPPRWPMYLRQMKQFIGRAARLRRAALRSLPDLLRACQKDGLLRLERDRQGGLRAFAGSYKPSNVPHGWGTLASPKRDCRRRMSRPTSRPTSRLALRPPRRSSRPSRGLRWRNPSWRLRQIEGQPRLPVPDEPDDNQLAVFGVVAPGDPEPVAKRGRRAKPSTEGDRPRRGRKAPVGKADAAKSPRGGARARGDDARPPRGRGRPRG